MRIFIIVPVSTGKWNQRITDSARQNLNPGVEFVVSSLQSGPEAIQSEYDEARAAFFVMDEVKKASQQGFDATVIWCFSDPGLNGAREISQMPVLGMGEASQAFALTLADRIGVITTLRNAVNRIGRKIKARKLDGRIIAIRPLEMPVLEYDQTERLQERALDTARALVNEDGVEALILGCGALSEIRATIQQQLEIPVIDAGAIVLRQAENLIRSGLCHSKRAFMFPLPVTEH